MAQTLDALVAELGRRERPVRVIVWAHNSHLGDARATAMGARGELNLGQLVRERCGAEALLVGFTMHRGTVTAASDWGGPAERKHVRPALPQSYERLLHDAGGARGVLVLRQHPRLAGVLRGPRLERAIGVVYRPETEPVSHYFEAWLPEQFDAVLHFDDTQAVEPFERTAGWERGEAPETYPYAV